MWANEPYYRPESRYDGRPRYMQVETEERPESYYRYVVRQPPMSTR